MPEYSFEGVDKKGTKVTSKLEAPTENDLRMILRQKGIRPTRIKKQNMMNSDLGQVFSGGAIPHQMIVIFTRQLFVLINSGIPLMQSLDILHEQSATPQVKAVLGSIRDRVSKGSYLWESLAAHPKTFTKLYIALIRAGEASGSLDAMLKRLSRYLEDAERLRKQVKGAMIYPMAVVIVGVLVIGVMLAFVIPKFEEMLKGNHQELPLPTQIVITASHFMINNLGVLVGGTGISVFLLLRYFRSDEGRAVQDRIFFNMPIFGPIIRMAGIARFSRTLQTLLTSGVNLLDAIEICRCAIDNAVLEEATAKIRTDIEGGQTLGMSIKKIPVFPKMTYQMIQVG